LQVVQEQAALQSPEQQLHPQGDMSADWLFEEVKLFVKEEVELL